METMHACVKLILIFSMLENRLKICFKLPTLLSYSKIALNGHSMIMPTFGWSSPLGLVQLVW